MTQTPQSSPDRARPDADRPGDATERRDRAMALLATYGADPDRWPPGDADSMIDAIALDPGLAAVRDREAALDTLLGAVQAPDPSPELQASVLGSAHLAQYGLLHRIAAWGWRIWPYGEPWQPAVTLALAALLGVWLGTAGLLPAAMVRAAEPAPARGGSTIDLTGLTLGGVAFDPLGGDLSGGPGQ